MDLYFGLDIGGTNIKASIIDSSYNELDFISIPTEKDAVLKTAAKCVYTLVSQNNTDISSIAALGAGVPGIIEGNKGPVVYTPNLPLSGLDLVKDLSDHLAESYGIVIPQDKIFIENDANCAGIAESVIGAGKDSHILMLLTLGTGLGGTVIIDGKPAPFGRYGGEFGHFPFMFGGKQCPCGLEGCLEQYTNSAAFKEFGFDRYTSFLSAAIAGYINIFRPDIVVLAGGVTNEGEEFFKTLNMKMKEYVEVVDLIII